MKAARILVHCLTPLHAGGGESQSGIEQAIARDRATNHPYLPASSLKGVLRQAARALDEERKAVADPIEDLLFGGSSPRGGEKRGAVAFGDAVILAFPVRSFFGTFAWVSSPSVLRRWVAAHRAAVPADGCPPAPPNVDLPQNLLVATKEPLIVTDGNRVILEDFEFTACRTDTCTRWADHIQQLLFSAGSGWEDWAQLFMKRFCIIHDDVLNFLLDYATELAPRVALDENKHVKHFWHEESLPTESILGSFSTIDPPPAASDAETIRTVEDSLATLCTRPLQLGGDETIGRGIARLAVSLL